MASIKEIIGVSEREAERLRDAGVRTCEQLIEVGATSAGRMRLADEANLDDATIKSWVHQADLMRIPGIGPETAHLLCQVGVCTVPKLAYRSTTILYDELKRYAEKVHKLAAMPSFTELHDFTVSAKRLPKLIRH
jgi:predicted flap endonuclease-1-like 5' DNA nuclease